MIIDDILKTIKSTLQQSSGLISVTNYHLVDGMIPGGKTTISIGCGEIKYEYYDRTQDEARAPIRIYVYTTDIQAERGESSIRSLAAEIRYTLLENMYLGGMVDESSVDRITFDSDQTDKGMLLHFAIIEYSVKYYDSRKRPLQSTVPTVEQIEVDTDNGDSIVIDFNDM